MKKILLLLANGFEAVEANVLTDNKWEGDDSTKVVKVGSNPQLQCTWNFIVAPEKLLHEISLEDFDALAISGGFEEAGFYDNACSEEFQKVIRHFDEHKKPIATVCVASLISGHSGILH